MDRIKLLSSRGFLGLLGPGIDELASTALESISQPICASKAETSYHVTVLTKAELQNVKLSPEEIHALRPDTSRVYSVGVGGNPAKGIHFAVIIWAEGQRLRKRLGLPPKHFHITLGRQDNHDVDKSIHSLLPGQFPESPHLDLLDHLIFTLHIFADYSTAQKYSTDLILAFPSSFKGFLRLADAASQSSQWKLAMLSYACAYERAFDSKSRNYCLQQLRKCSEYSEWACVFQALEMSQLPHEIAATLVSLWTDDLKGSISDLGTNPVLYLESRIALHVPILTGSSVAFHRLPRFFRWIVPFHLAAMSTPRNEDDIALLAAIGIRTVLTLTEEEPLPRHWFENKPISNIFLPVPNYYPPSIEQMDIVMRLVDDDSKLPLLVHCGGGKGRAGTVIACYLAAYGFSKPRPGQDHPEMSAAEAISVLRSFRPGSLETAQQEAFVSKWCSTIWKRQSVHPDLPSEPPPCSLVFEGSLEKEANLFVLVGLPGSGKSWFSQALSTRDPKGWTRISQDEAGSRSFCETEIGYARNNKVLLDRCNTAASDRKIWLSLASNWARHPVCIWFDYERHLCESRAQTRSGHPILPPGNRVRNAVDQMDRVFIRPNLEEEFKTIVIVRSFAAAYDLVVRLSPPLGIYKFPRTSHLLNLGAATSDDIINNSPLPSSEHVVITEKIDGANMGFSLSSDRSQIVVQNRSHYVNPSSHEQFKKLGLWVDRHREDLYKVLDRDEHFAERYILFGEWLSATHSIPYTRLPDRFIAFDLYDRSTDTFMDRQALKALLEPTMIAIVPVIHEGLMPSNEELEEMVQKTSKYWDGRVEGVYIKSEKQHRVVWRGKVVRADFISGNKHWSKGHLQWNGFTSEDV